jgi:predicted metal-dependent HD superfamily phosphohydrolase
MGWAREHCLGELSCAWDYAVHLQELRWALIFHDAVYDPHRDDNEVRSADWACRVMEELCRPEDEKARVRGLILATAHTSEPRTADEALLLDIDWSILGADEATFDEYDRSIRVEYGFIPEHRYREARAEVLTSFLRRERLFHTAPYRQRPRGPRTRQSAARIGATAHGMIPKRSPPVTRLGQSSGSPKAVILVWRLWGRLRKFRRSRHVWPRSAKTGP